VNVILLEVEVKVRAGNRAEARQSRIFLASNLQPVYGVITKEGSQRGEDGGKRREERRTQDPGRHKAIESVTS